jgi:hypothetical protein
MPFLPTSLANSVFQLYSTKLYVTTDHTTTYMNLNNFLTSAKVCSVCYGQKTNLTLLFF